MKILQTILIVTCMLAGQGARAGVLGVADDFNLFSFNGTNVSSISIGGRVAAGGNLTANNAGIASALAQSNGARHDLVVGGNLSVTNTNSTKGNVRYGGTLTTSGSSVTAPNTIAQATGVIDFAGAQTQAINSANNWSSLANNGNTKDWGNGNIRFRATGTGVNVFTVTANALDNNSNIELDTMGYANVTFLINVSGTSASFSSLGFTLTNGATANQTLFNFYEATALSFTNLTWRGTIYAPNAAFSTSSAAINGQVIADSISASGTINGAAFTGNLAMAGTGVPLPPSVWAGLAVLVPLAAHRFRRARAQLQLA